MKVRTTMMRRENRKIMLGRIITKVAWLLLVLLLLAAVVRSKPTILVHAVGSVSVSTASTTSSEEEFEKIAPTCHLENDDDCSAASTSSGIDPINGYVVVETAWGVAQQVGGGIEGRKTQNVLKKMYNYMTEQVGVGVVDGQCKLRDKHCAFWASVGECESNPAYMTEKCAPVCQTCGSGRKTSMSYEQRCHSFVDKMKEPGVWHETGQLNDMFSRITTDPQIQQLYSPTILSHDPWIVQLDNFTTPEECQHLISIAQRDYNRQRRSEETNKKKDNNIYRTSSIAWCSDDCERDPVTNRVHNRMQQLTDIPHANYEHLQLLRYEETQFYVTHHDYIDFDLFRPQGVRILTIFLYLNDVEEGGGTNFPNIPAAVQGTDGSLTVTPQQGRVVLWPSVVDANPNKKDNRTDHQALPVIKGIKYSANAWAHQRDYKTPHSKNCN